MKSNEVKSKFIELRAMGLSYDRISKELKTSKPTLIVWGKDYNKDIQNLQAIEIERLYEKFSMNKVSEIKMFGKFLEKVREELLSRDLKKISTEKLFSIYFNYSKEMRDERDNLKLIVRTERHEVILDNQLYSEIEL